MGMRPVPATAKGRRSRDAIVEAAAELMRRRGIAATSVDDVLAASGTGKSQLYHYFRGKQDLTVAMLRRQFELVLGSQPSLLDPSSDDIGPWRDEIVRTYRQSRSRTCPLGVFAGQVVEEPVLGKELAGLFDQWRLAITGLVRRAQDAGHLRADVDPGAAGTALLAAMQGGIMLSQLQGDERPLEHSLDHVIADLT